MGGWVLHPREPRVRHAVGGPHASAPNVASIAGGATRDAIALRCHARRRQPPCASSATSRPTRSTTADLASGVCGRLTRAFQRVELLAERKVLKHQFVMSAAGQGQRTRHQHDCFEHASSCTAGRLKIKRSHGNVWGSGEGQSTAHNRGGFSADNETYGWRFNKAHRRRSLTAEITLPWSKTGDTRSLSEHNLWST